MVYPALLPLMRTPQLPVVDWTDAPADWNGLFRFAERRYLVSARVPSHFNWPTTIPYFRCQTVVRSDLNLVFEWSTQLHCPSSKVTSSLYTNYVSVCHQTKFINFATVRCCVKTPCYFPFFIFTLSLLWGLMAHARFGEWGANVTRYDPDYGRSSNWNDPTRVHWYTRTEVTDVVWLAADKKGVQ